MAEFSFWLNCNPSSGEGWCCTSWLRFTLALICVCFRVCACALCGHGSLKWFSQTAARVPEACNVCLPSVGCRCYHVWSVKRVCWHMLSVCLTAVTLVTAVGRKPLHLPLFLPNVNRKKKECVCVSRRALWDVNRVICTDEIKLSEGIIPAEMKYTALISHVRSVGSWGQGPEDRWCKCVWNGGGDWCGLQPACWSKTSPLGRIQPLWLTVPLVQLTNFWLLFVLCWLRSTAFQLWTLSIGFW